MSDIIKDAKQILGGATPGKWRAADSDIIAGDTSRFIATVSEYSGLDEPSEEYANVQLIAAAPEMAQALAEETYEYAVQVKCTENKEWRLLSFKLPFITHKTTWFRSQSEAEHQRQEQVSEQVNSRIVRRRVSPVEVINE